MKREMRGFFAAAVIVCLLLSCKTTQSLRELVDAIPAKNLSNYTFSAESGLAERLNVSSSLVMSYLMEYDDPYGSYTLYEPSAAERTLLGECFELLPEYQREILTERLVGIYFVENFLGSGMTDYLISESDEIYTIIILNPNVLKKDLSELLTFKESTIYRDENDGIDVKIDISGEYSGLLYILAHESTHVADYVDRITYYIEPGFNDLLGKKETPFPFSDACWSDYAVSKVHLEYGKRLNFYSADHEGKIPDGEMIDVYEELQATPFVSLYSYLSWAEDLAEYCAMYHLTQKLGISYVIRVLEDGQTLFEYEPFSNPRVLERAVKLDFL